MYSPARHRVDKARDWWDNPIYRADGYLPAVLHDVGNQQLALPAYGNNLATGVATTTVTTEPGKLYELSATGSGSITIAVGTAASGTNILSAATYATARYFVSPVATTHLTVNVSSGALTGMFVKEVRIADIGGTNMAADTYTMSVNGGSGTATESPSGTLNLTGDGTNAASGEKAITTVVGTRYTVICLVASNAATVQVGTTSGGTQTVVATSLSTGTRQISFTATATTHYLRFSRTTASLSTVNNITMVEVTPNVVLRSATFSEVYTFTCSSTTARTYINRDGLIKNDLATDTPRYSWNSTRRRMELLLENVSTNLVLYSNDFTNAAWTKSNMTTALTATGPDGVANSASTLTATAGNATALQAITSASSIRITSCWIKRRTGSGTVNITHDNGTTWTAVTVTSSWTRVSNPSTTSTNPTVGIRIVTSGDEVDVAYFQHEAESFSGSGFITSAIPTTSATVTRAVESCRFSPLVEAIFQQPAFSAKVQGALIYAGSGNYPTIVGMNADEEFLHARNTTTTVGCANTSSAVQVAIGSGLFTTGYGVVGTLNSSGRSVAGNVGSVATDTSAVNNRSYVAVGRFSNTTGTIYYGNGTYYLIAVYPFRISDAAIPAAAAVPS